MIPALEMMLSASAVVDAVSLSGRPSLWTQCAAFLSCDLGGPYVCTGHGRTLLSDDMQEVRCVLATRLPHVLISVLYTLSRITYIEMLDGATFTSSSVVVEASLLPLLVSSLECESDEARHLALLALSHLACRAPVATLLAKDEDVLRIIYAIRRDSTWLALVQQAEDVLKLINEGGASGIFSYDGMPIHSSHD
mmetsp:Transcript_114308/g.369591  ORF Transcript_114308/g.369591 Transcript_114308/m.369591 type:complete len:194 (+) Transcript_114308:1390-1971(+)